MAGDYGADGAALAQERTNSLAAAQYGVHIRHMAASIDHVALATQLLRALRGRRSQKAFSRRLGYSSNVAYPWESGRRFPTAAETFRVAARIGIDVRAAIAPFFQRQLPDELRDGDPTSRDFVAALLRAARGKLPMRLLAERIGQSRSAISRLLSGANEPRLPVFLHLIDASTRRLLDLLAGFVDVGALPAAKAEWGRLEALRRLAYDNPLSEAVPRFLELEQYAALPRHVPGWIAERLGVERTDEERTIADLEKAGVIAFDGKRWQLDRSMSVDTSRDPRSQMRLVAHWTRLASERMAAGAEGKFSYLVFGTDDETLAAIQELRLRYIRELRTLVRKAPESTRVLVANMHLFPIDVG
jgi:transcriptional regulator with XRE-family HTH domain